jgi:hypothetical protein
LGHGEGLHAKLICLATKIKSIDLRIFGS